MYNKREYPYSSVLVPLSGTSAFWLLLPEQPRAMAAYLLFWSCCLKMNSFINMPLFRTVYSAKGYLNESRVCIK